MRLSVVIPAHNEEAYIGKTIEAVLRQSYGDLELIIVDNNSTDGTAREVKKFPNVKYVLETTKGVQFAREKGRQMATGEIIANLDADCQPPPDWAERGMKYFESLKIVAVSGPYKYYGGTLFFRLMTFAVQHMIFTALHYIFLIFFGRGAIAMGGNIFMRAKALANIGGYNTKIAFYGDDTDTINRMATQGKTIYTKKIAVESSARRFQKLGVTRLLWRYLINYFWVVVFKKPYG